MAERKRKSISDTVVVDEIGRLMGMTPPQALDVEEAVLGAMLLEPACIDDAIDSLKPNCFYSERHRFIFEAMSALANEHQPIDAITVASKLIQQGKLEAIGGPSELETEGHSKGFDYGGSRYSQEFV